MDSLLTIKETALFSLQKLSPSFAYGDFIWLSMVYILNCNSLLILNKSVIAEEIRRSLFDLDQSFGGTYRDQNRFQTTPVLMSKNRSILTIDPIVAHCFAHIPWNLKVCLYLGPTLMPAFSFEVLQALFRIYFKILLFLIKFLFCV